MIAYSKEAAILRLLDMQAGQYGLELVRHSAGALKRGTVYTTLQRMEAKGLVQSRQEKRPSHESGSPRRFYSATRLGRRELTAINSTP